MKDRILGLDIGEKRIGVAVSDPLMFMAHPLTTLIFSTKKKLCSDLEKIIEEKNIIKVVIGLPFTLKKTYSEKTKEVLDLSDYLKTELTVPIEMSDERLTTLIAKQQITSVGKKPSKSRHIIDQMAAVNILQTYLDLNRNQLKGVL